MEKILFNANHVKVSVSDCRTKTPIYRIGFVENHCTYYPPNMTITETKRRSEYVIKESPLGFYYGTYEMVKYQEEVKVGVKAISHVFSITVFHRIYRIEYYTECGDVKIGFDARPWDICVGDKSLQEHFIKALKKILDEIFVIAASIKNSQRTKERIYTELFGNPKGDIDTLPNEIKIVSHGFDPKESFRKRKKVKTWKKKKTI